MNTFFVQQHTKRQKNSMKVLINMIGYVHEISSVNFVPLKATALSITAEVDDSYSLVITETVR
jgi:hypothetical protein